MQTKIVFLSSLQESLKSISLPCTIRTFGIIQHYSVKKGFAILEYESNYLLLDCSLIPQFYYEPTTMYYFYGKLSAFSQQILEEPFRTYCINHPYILQLYFFKSVEEMEQQGVNKIASNIPFPIQQYQQIILQKYSSTNQ